MSEESLDLSGIDRVDVIGVMKLITKLNFFKIKYNFNKVIIPMSLYNIIIDSKYFIYKPVNEISLESSIGLLSGYNVYLDIALKDIFIITYEIDRLRDVKLDLLLNNNDNISYKKIKIINE
jgi:hypothetical protein